MSGGGGGSSGAVSHSVYLEYVHTDWLDSNHADAIEDSITGVMNAALGSSPWTGLSAYDPAAPIAAYEAVMTAFKAILAGVVDTTSWAALFAQAVITIGASGTVVVADKVVADAAAPASLVVADIVPPGDMIVADKVIADKAVADMADSTDVTEITDAAIILDTAALADQIDDEITAKILPRFRRGMTDINAVVSSAFPIGEAIIEGFRDRDVAKHASTLRVRAAEVNAEIRTNNERNHVEVGKANLSKDVEVAKLNLTKDVEVAKNNQTVEAQYKVANINKSLKASEIDVDKAVKVGLGNLNKDMGIVNSNLSKTLNLAQANMNKDIEVGKFNIVQANDTKRMELDAVRQMLGLMLQRISWEGDYARMSVEANRIKITALKEQADQDFAIDEHDAMWDLEVFQFGANVMAAIQGGTSNNPIKAPTKLQSAIGGAMSGAAAGAMVGTAYGTATAGGTAAAGGAAGGAATGASTGSYAGVYGAAIGAVLGAAYGLLSN